jgi:hypothetical protein
MQAYILPLVVLDVDSNFGTWTQAAVGRGFEAFQIGPDHIIGRPGRQPLKKLAAVIRILLPFGFLTIGAPNPDFDSVYGTIIGPPHCARD